MHEKTIAAISTARGQGGVGVIRISGPEAVAIAEKVFVSRRGRTLKDTPGYTARYGKIFDGDECVDDVVALVFRAPYSYTGEDVVELSCHGGIFLTERVLRLVIENGAELAGPGEFTQRAFLNGKMGLTEAESVMDLIGAHGEQAARAAVCTHEGALSARIFRIKDALVALAAQLSAFIDYPDEDVADFKAKIFEKDLINVIGEMENLLETYDAGRVLREGVDTAIVGKPNVGKSTLMNFLLGCERCIVTDIPGTTRDLIEETLVLGDVKLRVTDTAGVRETDDVVEKIGVDKAYKKINEAQLVLAVFDFSRDLDDDDKCLLEKIKKLNAVAVVNKTDLPQKLDVNFVKSVVPHVVFMSAKESEGLKDLEAAVTRLFKINRIDPTQGVLSNQRQFFAAKKACESLKEAKNAILAGVTLDAVAVLIEEAIEALLRLTGERVTDEVVKEVFSKFCVGK